MNSLSLLRIISGFIYIIFIPGFLFTIILFPVKKQENRDLGLQQPDKKLDWFDRILLSFAFSAAVVPLTLFFLSKLGMKINQLNVIITTLMIITLEVIYIFFKNKLKSKKSNFNSKPHDNSS